jgi:hypothetical protein
MSLIIINKSKEEFIVEINNKIKFIYKIANI